jgi:hypothetical protein
MMRSGRRPAERLICGAAAILAAGCAHRITAIQDFSFAQGPPIAGSTGTECGRITLSTTHAEPMGGASFRNIPSAGDAEVILTLDGHPTSIELAIDWVRADEYLKDFSVQPTRVTGTLVARDALVTTVRPYPADDGAGTLVWEKLRDARLRFVVGGPPGTALGLRHLVLTCDR